MDRKQSISRRQFLARLPAALAACLGALAGTPASAQSHSGLARPQHRVALASAEPSPVPAAYLPLVVQDDPCSWPPFCGKVVHVHSDAATSWPGDTDDYWNYVDQPTVNLMVERGLRELTGAPTSVEAWRILLPDYQAGQKVAIKVNFNNTVRCASTAGIIDALIQPVNAVAAGLIQMGVAAADICVYDAKRALPDRFVSGGLPGLSFFDNGWEICTTEAKFTDQPASRVAFYPPPGVTLPKELATDVLLNATYLINMPIMKGGHPLAGVTLGFKNHFGSISYPPGLHKWVQVVSPPPEYRTDYNPLVDLMRSPLIGRKTVLTMGDALFAAHKYNDHPPVPWTTFDNRFPNSLFFAADPVAIDCVMHDWIVAEPGTYVPAGANNYLRLAAQAGLGIFEQGDPLLGSSGYQNIQYVRAEL